MGLIFTPYNAGLVVSEVKTKTWRPQKLLDTYSTIHERGKVRPRIYTVERNGRVLWRVGNTYAVQPGRGKHGIGHIKLLKIELQMLGAITRADAKAEGFYSKAAFFRAWWELYPSVDHDLSQMVWVLTFKLVDAVRSS